MIIQQKLSFWKQIIIYKHLQQNKIANLCIKNYTSNFDCRFTKVLCNFINIIKLNKNKAARRLRSFCRSNIITKFHLRKNKALKNVMTFQYNKANYKLKAKLLLWYKEYSFNNLVNKTKVIQGFLRKKQNMLSEKRINIIRGLEKVKNICQNNTFKIIKEYSINRRLITIFTRFLDNIPKQIQSQILYKYVKLWTKNAKEITKDKSITRINNLCRSFLINKLYKRLKLKKNHMQSLIHKMFYKYFNKEKVYFNKWKLITIKNKIKESAKFLSSYFYKKLIHYKKVNAINKMKNIMNG